MRSHEDDPKFSLASHHRKKSLCFGLKNPSLKEIWFYEQINNYISLLSNKLIITYLSFGLSMFDEPLNYFSLFDTR